MSKKIDLFEKYMKENGTNKIHSDTVFEGYPIGEHLITIRQSIIYGNNKIKYKDEDKKRLEKLGLLYKEEDNIENKIERLTNYCEKYPYAFYDTNYLKRKFKLEGNIEELRYLEELYQTSYCYIITRARVGALSKDIKQYLKEAKIGGAFGLSKEDEELAEKYKINDKILAQLNMEFGSIDNFRKAYIQYKIDLSKAKTDQETQRVFNANSNIRKYLLENKLPIVKDFNFSEEKYSEFIISNRLIYAILWNGVYPEKGIIVDDEACKAVKSVWNGLAKIDKEVIDLNFGINSGETKNVYKKEKRLNMEKERIEKTIQNFLNSPETKETKKAITEHIYEPTEEFIKDYFKIHDIFYSDEEPQITKKNADKLMKKCIEPKKDKKEKLMSKQMHSKGIFYIDEIDLNARIYRNLTRNGITTTAELLERIEKPEDFNKIRILSKKSIDEVVNKIHSLGLKFRFEEENDKIIKQKLVQKVLEQQKTIEKQNKEIEELRAIDKNKEL